MLTETTTLLLKHGWVAVYDKLDYSGPWDVEEALNAFSVAPHGDYDKIGLSCLHPLGNSNIPTWN